MYAYATVDMQSTAEEQQQAASRISYYATLVRGTCTAERDFHMVLKAVFRLVGVIILLCGRDQCGLNTHSVDPDSMRIESWSNVDRPLIMVHILKLVFHTSVFI